MIRPARKRRVFLSFDHDNDEGVKDSFVGETKSPDCPFEIVGWSSKEEEPQGDWLSRERESIERSDNVIVMLGAETYRAPGVLKEITIANELGKKVFQVVGYRNRNFLRVSNAGHLFDLDWDILAQLLTPVEDGPESARP